MSKWYDDLDHRCQFCAPAIDRIREIDGALDKVLAALEESAGESAGYLEYEELDNETVAALRADKTRNLLYFSACNELLCGVTSDEPFAIPPAYAQGEHVNVFGAFAFTAACPDCQWIADAIAAVKADQILLSVTGKSVVGDALLTELPSERLQETWLSIALQMLWQALADCYQTNCPDKAPAEDGASLAAAFETPDRPAVTELGVTELAEPAAADGGSPHPIKDIPAHAPQSSDSPDGQSTAQYNEEYLEDLFTALDEAGQPEMSVALDEDGNLTAELPTAEQSPPGISTPVDLPDTPPQYQTWELDGSDKPPFWRPDSEQVGSPAQAFGISEGEYAGRPIKVAPLLVSDTAPFADGHRRFSDLHIVIELDDGAHGIPIPERFWVREPYRDMRDVFRFRLDFDALSTWLNAAGSLPDHADSRLWSDDVSDRSKGGYASGIALGTTRDGFESVAPIGTTPLGIDDPDPVEEAARGFFSGRRRIAGAILMLILGAAIGFTVFGGGDDASEVPTSAGAGDDPPATATSSVGGGLPAGDTTPEATPTSEAPVVATVVVPVGEGCGDIDTHVYEPFPATGFGIPGASPLNQQVTYAVVDGGVRICLEIPPEVDHEAVIAGGGYFLATLSLTVDNLLVELSVFSPGATAVPGRVIQRVGATEEATFDLTDSEIRGDAVVIFVPARREGGNLVFDLGGATYGTLSFIGLAAGSFNAGDPTPLWSGAVAGDVAVFDTALNWP